jgi:hypothetical protein
MAHEIRAYGAAQRLSVTLSDDDDIPAEAEDGVDRFRNVDDGPHGKLRGARAPNRENRKISKSIVAFSDCLPPSDGVSRKPKYRASWSFVW